MKEEKEGILKVYASTTDKADHKLLYESIVHLAHEEGISGVTVYRGIMGYGESSRIQSTRFWELTEKLPVVIELVDARKNLKKFYKKISPLLESMPKGCIVTMEKVNVLLRKTGSKKIKY